MAKKRLKVFMEKVRFKYKVSILNENTLEETFSVRLSWLYVFLLFSTILLLSFFLCSIIIMRTPIRQFIPGFEDVGVKAEVIHHSLRVDSLAEQVALQQDYIHVLSQLVAGEVIVSEIADVDSIIVEQKKSANVEKTLSEQEFCATYENEEQYNLVQARIQNPTIETAVFYPPVKGLIAGKFDPQTKHYGIDVISTTGTSVMSVLDGTVCFTGFTIKDGYVIAILHKNGYMSVYKNNAELLKMENNKVSAGEAIAILGDKKETNSQKPHLHVELWHNGKPINPEDYIIF